jgi:L-histidine N-alpha-methyltransferase
MQTYEILTHNLTGEKARELELQQFTYNVLEGLTETPKRLSSRYIYDDHGSDLFQRITELDEYTPTQGEFEIFRAHGDDILATMNGEPFNLVDLGAGDGRKTKVLIERARALGLPFRYVPIDISEGAMSNLVERMGQEYAAVEVNGLVSEYFDGIAWLGEHDPARRNLVLFLGSNIGNFPRPQARAFLRRLWSVSSARDHVLIGFDLKKDIEVLLAAYNDREGVTAQFNSNLLTRINRELGGNFDTRQFRHYATYNVFSGAMESYLVSLTQQVVYIEALQMTVTFKPWEPIHTEYSYKYLRTDVERLAKDTGYVIESTWADERNWFVDALWRPIKEVPPHR